MPTHLTCGLCEHRQDMKEPEDILKYERDKYFMLEHYKWEHPDRFGVQTSIPGIAFSDRWEFGPIPDDIGPVLHYEGDTFPWSQV